MENNNFDNIPEKFRDDSSTPPPFAEAPQLAAGGGPPHVSAPEMTLKDWIITIILLFIPCVNLIMLIIWAASGENKTRSTFAKAYLIVFAGVIVLYLLLWIFLLGAIFSLAPMGW